MQQYPNEIRIFEDKHLIAVHNLLTGRGQRQVQDGHRLYPAPSTRPWRSIGEDIAVLMPGESVHQRPLAVYEAVGQALATEGAS